MAIDIPFVVNGENEVLAAGSKIEALIDRTTNAVVKGANAMGKLEGKMKSFAGQQIGKAGIGALAGLGVGAAAGLSVGSFAKDLMVGAGSWLGMIGGGGLGGLLGPTGAAIGAVVGGQAGMKTGEWVSDQYKDFFVGDTRKEYQRDRGERLKYQSGFKEFFDIGPKGYRNKPWSERALDWREWLRSPVDTAPQLTPAPKRRRMVSLRELGLDEFTLGLKEFQKIQYQNNNAFMPNYENTSN